MESDNANLAILSTKTATLFLSQKAIKIQPNTRTYFLTQHPGLKLAHTATFFGNFSKIRRSFLL